MPSAAASSAPTAAEMELRMRAVMLAMLDELTRGFGTSSAPVDSVHAAQQRLLWKFLAREELVRRCAHRHRAAAVAHRVRQSDLQRRLDPSRMASSEEFQRLLAHEMDAVRARLASDVAGKIAMAELRAANTSLASQLLAIYDADKVGLRGALGKM